MALACSSSSSSLLLAWQSAAASCRPEACARDAKCRASGPHPVDQTPKTFGAPSQRPAARKIPDKDHAFTSRPGVRQSCTPVRLCCSNRPRLPPGRAVRSRGAAVAGCGSVGVSSTPPGHNKHVYLRRACGAPPPARPTSPPVLGGGQNLFSNSGSALFRAAAGT